jgi:hypothetical protein
MEFNLGIFKLTDIVFKSSFLSFDVLLSQYLQLILQNFKLPLLIYELLLVMRYLIIPILYDLLHLFVFFLQLWHLASTIRFDFFGHSIVFITKDLHLARQICYHVLEVLNVVVELRCLILLFWELTYLITRLPDVPDPLSLV